MADIVFSFEFELLVAGLQRAGRNDGDPPAATRDGRVTAYLLDLAAGTLRSLPDVGSEHGVFLENGARLYCDVGNHLEYSGPECSTPYELVCQAAAADRILSGLAAKLLEQRRHLSEVVLSLVNVCYGDATTTWGAHESYSHRCTQERLRSQVVPFLASRSVIAGAGGWDNTSAGLRFCVSPRALHLEYEVGNASMESRPLFHVRDESLCTNGWKRWHNLTSEANSSHSSTLLKFGTTALVVAAIDAGVDPATGMNLTAPLHAARGWAIEPDARMLLADGREVRAVDVQRHYLEQVREAAGRARLPDWADDLCRVWDDVLALHDHDPQALSTVLDWRIKEAIYQELVDEAGFGGKLGRWSDALDVLRPPAVFARDRAPWRAVTQAELARVAPSFELEPARLPEFTALRAKLFELDTRYGQLGQGLFQRLDEAGVLHHRLRACDDQAIERARTEAPQTTRAKVRGQVIRRLAARRGGCRCYWQHIVEPGGRWLDLGDPFCREERWRDSAIELAPF